MKSFSVKQIHDAFIDHDNAFFEEWNVKNPHRGKQDETQYYRFRNFINHGTICQICGEKGTHYKLILDNNSNWSFQLFSNKGVLLTLDHIIPLFKGGSKGALINHQTLCKPCNCKTKNREDLKPLTEEVAKFINSLETKDDEIIKEEIARIKERLFGLKKEEN